MNSISYAERSAYCYCAICGMQFFKGDDCFDTELGPICMTDACVFRYLRECGSTVEETGVALGMRCKVWAEDKL